MFFGRVVRGGRKNFGIATKKLVCSVFTQIYPQIARVASFD